MMAAGRRWGLLGFPVILFFFCVSVAGFTYEQFQRYPHLSKRFCPHSINDVGDDPSNWPLVHQMDTFLGCNHIPRLFTAGLNISVEDTYFHNVISLRGGNFSLSADYEGPKDTRRPMYQTNITLQGARTESTGQVTLGQSISAIMEMAVHLSHRADTERQAQKPTTLFAQYGATAVGFFGGSHVDLSSIVRSFLHSLVIYLREAGPGRTLLFQICGDHVDRRRTVGIMIDTSGGLEAIEMVHDAVRTWNQAECVSGLETDFTVGDRTLWMVPSRALRPESSRNGTGTLSGHSRNDTSPDLSQTPPQESRTTPKLSPRAGCTTVKVLFPDTCSAIAQRCDVSEADLLRVNPGSTFCNDLVPDELVCCNAGDLPRPEANADGTCRDIKVEDGDNCRTLAAECGVTPLQFQEFNQDGPDPCGSGLMAGEWVCCTPGELPDHSPKPNADGSCATYVLTDVDLCWEVAKAHEITVDQLIEYNEGRTWGWSGCDKLFPNTIICLSPGDPPLPLPIPAGEEDVMCGPRKRGTEKPPSGTEIGSLNPCPLKACCNGWGWCGTTTEFCTPPDGEPITAANSDYCISNCGTDIIQSETAPEQFMSIAYFEAWNRERPCLWMDVDKIDRSHTHIHYAFGRVTPGNYAVDVSASQAQFDKFVKLTGVKRVISFGGWADSTEANRSFILREAISGGREKFARNVVDFVIEHDLDGLDIDWEYPGATDIDGIVPDDRDGGNYLETVKLLRSMLPADKTLAIAAPASFWYLRGFSIEKMAEYLDYIVYMTYDLHGQWDWGNEYGQVGCPNGDCLRSHVNLTETDNALSMITKAGVPSHKIIVGVTSYGRSFRMVEPGCTGPECKYVGPESGAKKGLCTGESGYISDAEIRRIIEDGTSSPWELEGRSNVRRRDGVQVYHDAESMSDILVYDDVEWVAYMSEPNKLLRRNSYKALNFGGITDWAVDLQEFSPDEYLTPYVMQQIDEGGSCTWKFTDGVDCLNEGAQDSDGVQKWRWNMLATDCAWRFVKSEWAREGGPDSNQKFAPFVSKVLDGPELFDCHNIGERGCSGVAPDCMTYQTIESGPAAMLIISSFMAINRSFSTLYEGVVDSTSAFLAGISQFISTFSPAPPEKKDDLNIFIDVLGIAFTFLGVGVFKTLAVEGNRKDLVWNLVAWGGSLIKDLPRGSDGEPDRRAIIETSLYHLQNELKDQFEAFNKYLFEGEDESLTALDDFISEGKWITGKNSGKGEWSRKSVENMNMRLLHAWLIPTAWSAAQRRPVVIDAGKCEPGTGDYEWLTSKTAEATGGCVDGRQYFLVTTDVEWKSETPNCFCPSPCQGGPPPCWDDGHTNYFLSPPGNDKLIDGIHGLKQADMLEGAVNTWKHNGKKNIEDPVKVDRDLLDDIYDERTAEINVKAPGIIRVPVCDAAEAYANWKKEADPTTWHYPCNSA